MQARKNISDNIYSKLKEMFISGELDFGDKIAELDLCEKLNVSRTPLREAIKKLEIEGIVERTPNGRMKITDMNEDRIEEIFQIRIALEDVIFEKIMSKAVDENLIKRLADNINLTEFQISNSNWKETRQLFSDYTKILYEYSGLEFTLKILKSYTCILGKLRRKSLRKEERIKEALEEHKSILKFLVQNNLEEVKKINRVHLNNSKKSTLQYFNQRIK